VLALSSVLEVWANWAFAFGSQILGILFWEGMCAFGPGGLG
jgi:hypothetical protein